MRKMITLLIIVCLLFLVGCQKSVEEKQYIIHFEAFNDQTIADVTLTKPDVINLPTPVRVGFIFQGWYPNQSFIEATKVTNDTIIGKTITLYAKWEAMPITLTYDLDGGSFNNSELPLEVTIQAGSDYTILRAYKDGYLFMGYSSNNQMVSTTQKYYQDTTLKAVYLDMSTLEESYSVALNLNSGHIYQLNNTTYFNNYSNISNTLQNDLAQTLGLNRWELYYQVREALKDKLIGNGSFFEDDRMWDKWRWLAMLMASITTGYTSDALYHLAVNNYYVPKQDITFEQALVVNEFVGFLNWDISSVEIDGVTYYSYDYSQEIDIFTKYLSIDSYETGVGAYLPIPMRDEYIFAGWYDNENFTGEAIYSIPYNAYGDKTYYAKWQK